MLFVYETLFSRYVRFTRNWISSSHQRVKPEDLLTIKIVYPSDSVLKEFTQKIQPRFVQIQSNKEQSNILAAIHDALLPKLLSGELRVKDVEGLWKIKTNDLINL